MKTLSTFLLFLLCAITTAQVEFNATASRTDMAANERTRVEFKMNVVGDNFAPPQFDNFKVVAGPSVATSQQWINGKGTVTKSFTYIITPTKKGAITLGQATMTYDGKQYSTQPLKFNVTGEISKPRDPDSKELIASQNIHLVAEVTDASPYLNEAIRVVYKLYVSNEAGVAGWTEVESPKYRDFWHLNIDNRNSKVKEGTYKGKPYRYKVLREAVLYPQKTGKLFIEPLTLDINVQVPTDKRDFFGRAYYKTEPITVSAARRAINVKDLPLAGKPDSFTGAVGSLAIELSTDKKALKAGESLTARLAVSGNGNLKLLQLPKIKAPQGLELYEPELVDQVKTTYSGMRGMMAQDYTIVPQYGGSYSIPPVEFSYFDPKKEEYITLTTNEAVIEVDGPAPDIVEDNQPVAQSQNVTTPFAFIKTQASWRDRNKQYFFNSTAYWGSLAGISMLLPLALLFLKLNNREDLNTAVSRSKKASKKSRKHLAVARKNMGDQQAFYIALERALHQFLKGKLHITTVDMSKDKVNSLLLERNAQPETATSFNELLERCEFSRYTPASATTMNADYEQAVTTLTNLDKELKRND